MKLDRLLAITMLLLNRERVSAKELAERFEVSLRTIYRDLDALGQAGIPIVSYAGATGGYEIMSQYRLDRQFLSLEELQSIMIGLKGIRSSLDDHDIGHLIDKVGALAAGMERKEASLLSEQMLIDLDPWQCGEFDKAKLQAIRGAIQQNRTLAFTYTGASGETLNRVCEPIGVVLKGYIWYLYAYCQVRMDFRIFRLSRMEEWQVLNETFTRRPMTLERLNWQWMNPEPTSAVRLVLRFHPRAKAKVRDYFNAEQIVTEPDGTLLVVSTQPEEPWLYSMLLSYGADVTICEPATVAQAVVSEAKKIVAMYEAAPATLT